MRSTPAPLLALLAFLALVVALTVPVSLLLYSLGIGGSTRPNVSFTPTPGIFWPWVGGILLVALLSIVYAPAAWLVVLAVVAYWLWDRHLVAGVKSLYSRLRGGAKA